MARPGLLQKWIYAQGKSSVPEEWIFWSGLSMIAAACRDKVQVQFTDTDTLPLSLYVMLIGGAGIGKSRTIYSVKGALDGVLSDEEIFDGKITAPGFLDSIGTKAGKPLDDRRSKLYLLADELAFSVGTGENADQLIKLLTAYYNAPPGVKKERNRYKGLIYIKDPCINCFFGTTFNWLRDAITPDAIHGGFFTRIIPVIHHGDIPRISRPGYPKGRAKIIHEIQKKLRYLAGRKVNLRLTNLARKREDEWFYSKTLRPDPDETTEGWWNRQQALVLKLAGLLALSDSVRAKTIQERHIKVAISISNRILKDLPEVMRAATSGVESKTINMVYNTIRRYGTIKHWRLAQRASTMGINKDRLSVVLETLQEAKLISVVFGERGRSYKWLGEKKEKNR